MIKFIGKVCLDLQKESEDKKEILERRDHRLGALNLVSSLTLPITRSLLVAF